MRGGHGVADVSSPPRLCGNRRWARCPALLAPLRRAPPIVLLVVVGCCGLRVRDASASRWATTVGIARQRLALRLRSCHLASALVFLDLYVDLFDWCRQWYSLRSFLVFLIHEIPIMLF